jgi:VCPO second helical-bundle domain
MTIQKLIARGTVSILAGWACVTQVSAHQVVDWNQATLEIAEADGITSGAAHARTLAMVHLAMHDALNAIEPRYQAYAVRSEPSPAASPDAAVAAAAFGVLRRLFPAKISLSEQRYQAVLAAIPEGQAKRTGIDLGDRIAAELASLREADGFLINPAYTWLAIAPGVFQPVPPAFSTTAVLTGLPKAKPFTLNSASQFRAPGPPNLASADYTHDFKEVSILGAINSTARSVDQTAAAHFWREASSTQAWNRVARPLATAKVKDLWDSARLFALLNMTMADTAIAIFESKYHYHFWRPVTAIVQAESDGNSDTAAELNWTPLLTTPSHPEYPSGHAGYCAAAAHIMAFLLGDGTAFATTSPTSVPAGMVRSYPSFSQMAQECSDARVYAGIHFQTACKHGAAQGQQVAEWATQRFLRPLKSN